MVPLTQAILGEGTGGLPSHQQMITSKIEEQSGDVLAIGWNHVTRVLLAFLAGFVLAGFALLVEHLRSKVLKRIRPRIRVEQVQQRWLAARMRQTMARGIEDVD